MALPPELSPAQLRALLDGGAPTPRLLDVRNHDEWRLVRLPGATLIPLDELEERHGELGPPPGAPIAVYCHHGIRSLYGAEYLRSLGYETTSLRGGIEAWALTLDPTLPRY